MSRSRSFGFAVDRQVVSGAVSRFRWVVRPVSVAWLTALTVLTAFPLGMQAGAAVETLSRGESGPMRLSQPMPNEMPSGMAGDQPELRQFEPAIKLLNAGKFPEAGMLYERLLPQIQSLKHLGLKAILLTDLGMIYYNLGHYQKALNTYAQVRITLDAYQAYLRKNDRPEDTRELLLESLRESRYHHNLGLLNERLGQYATALGHYQMVLQLSRRNPSSYLSDAIIYNQIGNVLLKQGEKRQALEYYQRALNIIEVVGFPLGRNGRYTPLPLPELQQKLYGWQGQRTDLKLLDNIDKFDPYPVALLHPWARQALAVTSHSLGNYYLQEGNNFWGLQYHRLGYVMSQSIDDAMLQAESLKALGDAYHKLQSLQESQKAYSDAITMAQKVGDRALEGAAQDALGGLQLGLGQAQAAAISLSAAAAAWESLRPGLMDQNLASLFESQLKTYQRLQKALIAQNRHGEALITAERGRARALVELLSRRTTLTASHSPWSQAATISLDRIRQLAKTQKATLVQYSVLPNEAIYIWVVRPDGDLQFRQVSLATANKALSRQSLDNTIALLRTDSLGVRGRGAGRSSANTGRSGGRSAGSTTGIAGGAMARPLADEDRIAFQPQVAAVLTQPIPGVAASARFNDGNLRQLHQVLIEPIADLLPRDPNDRIVFIPQDSLFLVPFAALQDAQGRYLIERHTLSLAPSLQVLDLLQSQSAASSTASPTASSNVPSNPGAKSPTALVVGNPTMPKLRLMMNQPLEQLSPLPGAEVEAEAIAQILNTSALIGDAARENTVTARMPQSRTIHLATHGILDDLFGLDMPGALALAPTPAAQSAASNASMATTMTASPFSFGPTAEDGLLTTGEILDLNLKADLVVLSACDTGRGKITGDGVLGLSRSLLAAGASTVVVSLWAVPDDSTSVLMTEFYQQLQRNPDKAIALRQAMLKTLAQYDNPRDWAAFTLVGQP